MIKTLLLSIPWVMFTGDLWSANVGLATYGLPRFDQTSVGRVADALVNVCKHPDDPKKWVSNCRVEFSWLVTFSAAGRAIDTNNTRAVVVSALSRLPSDAILTVTTAIGFHSNENFNCSSLTSNTRTTADTLDDPITFCRKADKNGKCLRGEEFFVPSYKSRVEDVNSMIRDLFSTTSNRRGMLRFILIPHLEDNCSASQYQALRDWFDDQVPPAYADLKTKPSIQYRRSPNGDWPTHHADKTSSPRVSGNGLELHGTLGDTVNRKHISDTTVKSLLGSGDTYNPDGACIDWGNSGVLSEITTEFKGGVSILYWKPQMNGRLDCTTTPAYPQFDVRRAITDGFSDAQSKEFINAVRYIRDGKR